MTYAGEEIRVDALAERIDTVERNVEDGSIESTDGVGVSPLNRTCRPGNRLGVLYTSAQNTIIVASADRV